MYLVILFYLIIGIIVFSRLYIFAVWDKSLEIEEKFTDVEIILAILFCIIAWPVVIFIFIICFFVYFLTEKLNDLVNKYKRK